MLGRYDNATVLYPSQVYHVVGGTFNHAKMPESFHHAYKAEKKQDGFYKRAKSLICLGLLLAIGCGVKSLI